MATGTIPKNLAADVNTLNSKTTNILTWIDYSIQSLTIPSDGYLQIADYVPSAPTGYGLLFCLFRNYSTYTAKSDITINLYGSYVYGPAGTITGLQIRAYYMKTALL